MPGYRMGHEICEALAGSGVGWVNLHPETTTGLAHLVAGEELAEKGITFLPGQLATAVVEEIAFGMDLFSLSCNPGGSTGTDSLLILFCRPLSFTVNSA